VLNLILLTDLDINRIKQQTIKEVRLFKYDREYKSEQQKSPSQTIRKNKMEIQPRGPLALSQTLSMLKEEPMRGWMSQHQGHTQQTHSQQLQNQQLHQHHQQILFNHHGLLQHQHDSSM